MGLINWIFDIYQHHRIDQIQREASQARVEAATVHHTDGGVDLQKLESALGELALSVKTLQRTLLDKGVCTADELYDKLKQIDLEDGKADGRAPV